MYEEYLTKALAAVISARQALDNYEKTKIKDIKNSASYNAQQAIEYLVKYHIYNDIRYNENSNAIQQLFTHNLDMLIREYCIPYGIYVPKVIVKNAKKYSAWESESRYSLSYSVRTDSILTAIGETEAWLVKLKPSYKAKIVNVKKKLGIVDR